VDTSGSRYGRCADCKEIKQLNVDGLLQEHNRYQANGTSVAVARCPGSGRRPQDTTSEGVRT